MAVVGQQRSFEFGLGAFLPGVHQCDVHRYRLLMSRGFVLKCVGCCFYCMILGGKGGCFVLGNDPLGFRDEREIYH